MGRRADVQESKDDGGTEARSQERLLSIRECGVHTMTTKAISFLGYTRPDQPYRTATYCYGEQECTTPFMAEATARFFLPDVLLVLVTREARDQNFDDLAARLRGALPVEPVDIPSGKSEDELWA